MARPWSSVKRSLGQNVVVSQRAQYPLIKEHNTLNSRGLKYYDLRSIPQLGGYWALWVPSTEESPLPEVCTRPLSEDDQRAKRVMAVCGTFRKIGGPNIVP